MRKVEARLAGLARLHSRGGEAARTKREYRQRDRLYLFCIKVEMPIRAMRLQRMEAHGALRTQHAWSGFVGCR